MKKNKVIAFSFPVKMHAALKSRLLYDEIPMTKFVRYCIECYLNNEPHMMKFVDQLKEEKGIQNKIKRKANIKLVEKGEEIKELFGLNAGEIENVYDILEDEIKDWPEL